MLASGIPRDTAPGTCGAGCLSSKAPPSTARPPTSLAGLPRAQPPFYFLIYTGAKSWACLVHVADPFPRAGLSFLNSFFILFFLPDLEQGHPEVLILCPSPPLGLTQWILTLAGTGMEFATPPWASCPRPLVLLPLPWSISQGPKLFLPLP